MSVVPEFIKETEHHITHNVPHLPKKENRIATLVLAPCSVELNACMCVSDIVIMENRKVFVSKQKAHRVQPDPILAW